MRGEGEDMLEPRVGRRMLSYLIDGPLEDFGMFFFVFLRCVWWVFFRFFGCFLLFLGSVFVLNGDLCACSLFFVLRYSNLGSGAR